MRFSQPIAALLNFFVNECLPPFLRDAKWFMCPLFRLAFGDKARTFMEFRERGFFLTEEQYAEAYSATQSCHLKKKADFSSESLALITEQVAGETVLDVGCGRGFLAQALAERFSVTACDIVRAEELSELDRVRFVEARAEDLPFEDSEFDTVVCVKLLEHVRDMGQVLSELRRVASKRIIVILPIERPYRFAFNLHLHFFPYRFSVLGAIAGNRSPDAVDLRRVRNEWFYVEELADGQKGNGLSPGTPIS